MCLSWLIYVLAYYVVRHRHGVIREQLAKVFPDLPQAERTAIHKRFLKNFCDVLVELVKSMSIEPSEMIARVRVHDLKPVLSFLDAGRSVMLVTSHLGNWEWLLQGVTLQLGYPVDAAYKPLHDAWAERLVLEVRSRFGARLIPAKELLADFLRRRGVVRALAMNADQAPVSTDKRYWTRFLGQDTAFYVGAEQIARAMRLPVLYLLMRRVSRGRLRSRDSRALGRAGGARAQRHQRALCARLRGGRARSPGGLALVLPALEAEETALRRGLIAAGAGPGQEPAGFLILPCRCFARSAMVG